MDLKLSGISRCLLEQGDPCKPTSWVRKVLIGNQNRFLRLFCGRFLLGGPSYGVGSAEGGSLRASFSSESSG